MLKCFYFVLESNENNESNDKVMSNDKVENVECNDKKMVAY